MPTQYGGMFRFDINDPEDVQRLVNSGFAWRAGPETTAKIIDLIDRGLVTRRPDKEPPEIAQLIDSSPDEEDEEEPVAPEA